MEKYIAEFNYFLDTEKNYSRKTISTYNNKLKLFFNYLEMSDGLKNPSFDQLNSEHVKKYLTYLKNQLGNKPNTINLKISILKSFYKFLMDRRYITYEKNITNEIKQQKVSKTLPMYLTADEAENFLFGIKLISKNATRDYAMFSLFLLTGARLSEVTNLNVDQINLAEKTITFLGKGSKERTVPLVNRAYEAVLNYLSTEKFYIKRQIKDKEIEFEDRSQRGRIPAMRTNRVFLNKYGKPISERGIQDIFKRLSQEIGIFRKGLSVHKLRHTCLTLLHKSGVDILVLQKIAGHENIKTTQIYTHVDYKELHKHMELHPLNNKSYDNFLIQKIKAKLIER